LKIIGFLPKTLDEMRPMLQKPRSETGLSDFNNHTAIPFDQL